MKYKTGDIAALFGMTNGGVRFLESRGVISSQRDETNGYRYFDRHQITTIKHIRNYQAMGFTLNEAGELILNGSCETVLAQLEKKDAELAEQIDALEQKRKAIKMYSERLDSAVKCVGVWSECIRPAMYRVTVLDDEADELCSREEMLSQIALEKSWVNAMPEVSLSLVISIDENGEGTVKRGTCIKAETAERLGLKLGPRVEFYPERRCCTAVLEFSLADCISTLFKKYAELREKGLEVTGDALTNVIHMNRSDLGSSGLQRVWIPIR